MIKMSQDTMDKLRELKDRLRDPATYESHGWCDRNGCMSCTENDLEEVFKLLDALIASLE